jgi:thioredoxin-like negative regulator of GroEL
MFTVRGQRGMAVLGVALLALGAGPARCQDLPWRSDYAAARREAEEKGRPLLLDFGTTNCFWCKKLEQTTFRDAAVARVLGERFVLLKVDGEREVKLVQALAVRSYPTLVLAGPDGRILGKHEGYATVPQLSSLLEGALAAGSPRGPEKHGEAAAGGERPGPSPAALGVVVPATAAAPGLERVQAARALLGLARDDFQRQQYVACLERCRALGAAYADLPEGAEARRLADRIRGEPELTLRACADLSDRLGELYLGLGEGLLRQGQAQQAATYLERVLLVSPGSPHAQAARVYLARLRPGNASAAAGPAPRPPAP